MDYDESHMAYVRRVLDKVKEDFDHDQEKVVIVLGIFLVVIAGLLRNVLSRDQIRDVLTAGMDRGEAALQDAGRSVAGRRAPRDQEQDK